MHKFLTTSAQDRDTANSLLADTKLLVCCIFQNIILVFPEFIFTPLTSIPAVVD